MNNEGARLSGEIGESKVANGEALVCWLGQHSFILKLGDAVVYLDPFLSPSSKRLFPPLLAPCDITDADIVTGSHDHSDHIDRKALPALAAASPKAMFVVPRAVRDSLKDTPLPNDRIVGINAGETITLKGLSISAVPAAHEFLDLDTATGTYPYLGYIIEGNGMTVYHAGDTCIYEGMQATLRRWEIDLAFLPINGRDATRLSSGCIGNMTYQEAADLAGTLSFGTTIPTHYDMFENNSADPQPFMEYMKVKYPDSKTIIPEHWKPLTVHGSQL